MERNSESLMVGVFIIALTSEATAKAKTIEEMSATLLDFIKSRLLNECI